MTQDPSPARHQDPETEDGIRGAALRPRLANRLRSGGCVFAEEEADLIWSAAAAGSPSPRSVSGADQDARAADVEASAWAMVERRVAGEPLELIVGWAEVAGVRVPTGVGVFVPRHRSDLLVGVARRRMPPPPAAGPDPTAPAAGGGPVVVDLGCGSGALGLALIADRPDTELHAVDIDPVATRLARSNLAGRGTVHLGDGLG
ncbi:MAG: methyltransferase, partial [Acidimicrobiales bacterium]